MEKCVGIRGLTDSCENEAEFEVIGLVAVFGAPSPQRLCKNCLDRAKIEYPNGDDKIEPYNNYPLAWRKIGTKDNFVTLEEDITISEEWTANCPSQKIDIPQRFIDLIDEAFDSDYVKTLISEMIKKVIEKDDNEALEELEAMLNRVIHLKP